MFTRLDNVLSGLRKTTLIPLTMVFIVVLCSIDIVIGPELSFSIFYLGPILALTWYAGRKSGILAAILSSAAWFIADDLSGHRYSHTLIPLWNCTIRFGFFLISLVLLDIIKNKLKTEASNANTDSLTGLANSRFFYQALQSESYRSRRYRHPFTIVYIDLDGFKLINDSWGHAIGDDVLCEVANTIKDAIRRTDIVARIGGDEFVVLFPETDFRAAHAAITHLQNRLLEVVKQQGWLITSSIGAVTYRSPLINLSNMVRAADDLMYQVKKGGKNNILHRLYERPIADFTDTLSNYMG